MKLLIVPLLIFALTVTSLNDACSQGYDSVYYEKYLQQLCVSLNISNRNYKINILSDPYSPRHDTIDVIYTGNTPLTMGVTLDWDIFSLAVNFRSVNIDKGQKGLSDCFNIYFGFGNAKYIVETYYRYLKGFYDANSLKHEDVPADPGEYYTQPNLVQQVLKGKFIYVFNDSRFAFKNGYTAIYHQKKTSGSFLLQGNLYYNKQDNNNALVPPYNAKAYSYSYKVNYLSTIGAAVGGGGAGTVVFGKKFFLNGTLFLLAEFQHNNLKQTDGYSKEYSSVNASFDTRFCLGYNARKLYISFASRAETSIFRLFDIGLRSSVLFTDFNIGYRFNVKDPKFMKTVRNSGVYKVFD